MTVKPHKQPSEQRWFAWWIEWGARLGLLWLLVSFGLYVSGALPSAIPPARLAELWSLPLADYLQRSGAPTGWAWLQHIGQGEGATLAGVAVLAGCAVPALLALTPLFRRRRDLPYLALCLAQVAVLLLAASGWISSGH